MRPDIHWTGESERLRYMHLRSEPGAIEAAGIDEIALILTTLIRGDRFNEGMLASAFEDGTLHRILARVSDFAIRPQGA